jgi:hypothetical protein
LQSDLVNHIKGTKLVLGLEMPMVPAQPSNQHCELRKVASRVASIGDIELPMALHNIMEPDAGAGRGWIRYRKVAHSIPEESISHGWDRGSATEP